MCSKGSKKLFDPKFSVARTKPGAVIVNVISPNIFNLVLENLKKGYFHYCHYRQLKQEGFKFHFH